jgi:hypothetical protein
MMTLSTNIGSASEAVCYRGCIMKAAIKIVPQVLFVASFGFALSAGHAAQTSTDHTSAQEPSLPVIDENACPFEGCSVRKWIVIKDDTLFSSWKEDRKPVGSVKKGEIVTGLTGVHLTLQPDRIEVVKPIPELHLKPGDTFPRYMYQGEGFADIWVKGEWKKMYDCSFITEPDGSGCARNCSGKVASLGNKEWWVRVKTSKGLLGWVKEEGQFDCMDSLGGDDAKCANL